MKKNKIILAAIVLSSTLWSCGTKPYKVERTMVINTPAEPIYNQVINHKNRVNWSPWEMKDPNMKKEFEGPESGVGAIQKWSGNDEVGVGSLEIIEAIPYKQIKSKLIFTEPWESNDHIEWNFKEDNGVTNVTWSSSGEMPTMVSMFVNLEEEIGPDFEKGLENLKNYCESNFKKIEVNIVPSSDTTNTSDSLVN